MKENLKKYKDYNATAFLLDDDFIAWMQSPEHPSGLIWKNLIEEYPATSIEIENAKRLFNSIKSRKNKEIDSTIKDRVWERIQKQSYPGSKVIKMNLRRLFIAASIILIASSLVLYYAVNKNQDQQNLSASITTTYLNDIAPGGNKAVLKLSDGSTIVLDSAHNGLLSTQGNSKIIKLKDGQLAYNTSSGGKNTVMFNTISTPRGGQYQLQLSDGSNVWLNAASSITFPTQFSGTTREVTIKGEAYFEIAHDKKKPFMVTNGDLSVQVLGTHFNVKTYSDGPTFQVTLLEGGVNVINENNHVILSPGWQAIIKKSGIIDVDRNANIEEVMAWKNGKFIFNREDIQTIMRRLSRWYDIDVAYDGNISAHFGGTISMEVPISKVFEMLEMTGGASFKIEGKKVTVMRGDASGK